MQIHESLCSSYNIESIINKDLSIMKLSVDLTSLDEYDLKDTENMVKYLLKKYKFKNNFL